MERKPVVSSSIAEVGFDDEYATLEVMFNDGKVYQYFDVPRNVFDEMLLSDSIGRYFSTRVRGEYRFARVEEGKSQKQGQVHLSSRSP